MVYFLIGNPYSILDSKFQWASPKGFGSVFACFPTKADWIVLSLQWSTNMNSKWGKWSLSPGLAWFPSSLLTYLQNSFKYKTFTILIYWRALFCFSCFSQTLYFLLFFLFFCFPHQFSALTTSSFYNSIILSPFIAPSGNRK